MTWRWRLGVLLFSLAWALLIIFALSLAAEAQTVGDVTSGRGFAAGRQVPASAGNLSMVQLFNPAASTATVLIASIVIGADAVTWIFCALTQTELTVGLGAWNNLKPTGPAGTATLRQDQAASPAGARVLQAYVPAGGSLHVPLQTVLPPGWGLVCGSNVVNLAVAISFSGVEARP